MSIIKKSQSALLILLAVLIVTPAHAQTIPIPKKRPKIMSVSPAFLEELKNRDSSPVGKHIRLNDQNSKAAELNAIEPSASPGPLPPSAFQNNVDLDNLVSLDQKDIVDMIEPTKKSSKASFRKQSIPIPRHKPKRRTMQTSAEAQDEGTLVSFALQPGQINLDENLRNFLQDHALRLFNQKSNLTMEIQAYATATDSEPHGDVRVALARALEVRSFLINQNVSPNRLKLTPKGQDQAGAGNDRIDLLFFEQE